MIRTYQHNSIAFPSSRRSKSAFLNAIFASNSTGKELDEETGYGYFGARYMDHELMTGWLSVDPMADKYPNISPYAYCAWNPMRLVDPDGKEIDVSALYKKGRDGAYKYEFAVKAFEFFANTKIGRKELAKYAKSGQTIAGHTFTEDGKYHKKGISISFGGEVSKSYYSGDAGRTIDGNQLKLDINISNTPDVGANLEVVCHEMFIHAYQASKDFMDDGKLNNSRIAYELKNWNTSLANQEHLQDSRHNNRMKNDAIPILQQYYGNIKTRNQIIDLINSGMGKYSKVK